MKIIKYCILVSLVLFSSCEYEIDYTEDLPEDKLVIAGFLEEDKPVDIQIFHSARPGIYQGFLYNDMKKETSVKQLDFTDSKVSDAIVTLYNENLKYKETALNYDVNHYTFNSIPKAEDKILLSFSLGNYPVTECKVEFNLTKPHIDSCNVSLVSDKGKKRIILYLEINDDGGENYYMINTDSIFFDYYTVDNYSAKILYESHSGVYFETNTNVSFDEEDKHNEYKVFSNKKFAGKKYVLKLSFAVERNYYDERKEGRPFAEISKIDKNIYNYLYSLGNAINSQGLNTTPVTIRNSFENAYGFVGVKKSVKISIE